MGLSGGRDSPPGPLHLNAGLSANDENLAAGESKTV